MREIVSTFSEFSFSGGGDIPGPPLSAATRHSWHKSQMSAWVPEFEVKPLGWRPRCSGSSVAVDAVGAGTSPSIASLQTVDQSENRAPLEGSSTSICVPHTLSPNFGRRLTAAIRQYCTGDRCRGRATAFSLSKSGYLNNRWRRCRLSLFLRVMSRSVFELLHCSRLRQHSSD